MVIELDYKMKILIIKLGAIGDVIRTTSILHGLKEKYPGSEIDWLTKKESYHILKNNNLISKIFVDISIIKGPYDIVICLEDDDIACRLAAELKPKKIVGAYLKDGKKTYTDDSSAWFDMGLISKLGKKEADRLKVLNEKTYQELMYSILGLKYKKQEPILILNDKEKKFGIDFAKKHSISKNDLFIGMNTGAGGRWQDKKLNVDQAVSLIGKTKEKFPKSKILLFGGPEEKERNKQILDAVKSEIIDAGTDNSLMEFASLVGLCAILVTSDSLAMHFATALRKKTVIFFYPTSAAEIEVYGRGIKIIWEGKSYCSYAPKCEYPPKIEVQKIVDAIGKLV